MLGAGLAPEVDAERFRDALPAQRRAWRVRLATEAEPRA